MPLQATSGAASYDAFGGGAAAEPNYIESVFQTWLYTGNSSTQTITNGIDLDGEGGMVWTKWRADATGVNHGVSDTARGVNSVLFTNTNNEALPFPHVTGYLSNGFTLGANTTGNFSAATYVSWTFRKAPKFFDVVTYTGNNTGYRSIAHSLGVVPGLIIIKAIGLATSWMVWHKDLAAGNALELNSTAGANSSFIWFGTQTATHFQTGDTANNINDGTTYVAYLFAHNAGGFGLTGTDNVISCGSYTGNGSLTAGPQIDLGYEPQWLMVKRANSNGAWLMMDAMRGFPVSGAFSSLQAQTSGAEGVFSNGPSPTATGFVVNSNQSDMNQSGSTYIYIAIRRGPMKVPTTGTSVFEPRLRSGTGSATTYSANNVIDSLWTAFRGAPFGGLVTPYDRLRGNRRNLDTSSTGAENTVFGDSDPQVDFVGTSAQTVVSFPSADWNNSGQDFVDWIFTRAPGFFDEVCYTGTGSARTVAHNLAAVPELMIVKARNLAQEWDVYVAPLGATKYLRLDSTFQANVSSSRWNNTTPTSTNFTVGTDSAVNANTYNYVAYLFATCAGVSKVGSYTGTGTTLQIDCGFTSGARFVLIKRTDDDGFAWYVWDSARGIVAGNDPYLLLNSTAAEVTNTDYVDTYSAGFEISSTAPAAINASGGSFIFLAVA